MIYTTLLSCLLAITGNLVTPAAQPIAGAYVGGLDSAFTTTGYCITDAQGKFDVPVGKDGKGFLYILPTNLAYEYRNVIVNGETSAKITLKPTYPIFVDGLKTDGTKLTRDDIVNFGNVNGNYCYITDMDENACGPIECNYGGRIAFAVDNKDKPYIIHMLFWPVKSYGPLWLRADNSGKGFHGGDVVNINYELAKTAAMRSGDAALILRAANITSALDAEDLLYSAIKLRDEKELVAAQSNIPKIRQGTLTIYVKNWLGLPATNATVNIAQQNHSFRFGMSSMGGYNDTVYKLYRGAGFDQVAMLPASVWCNSLSQAQIDQYFGFTKCQQLGFKVKETGAVWLNPDLMAPGVNLIDYEKKILGYFPKVQLWEAINEPNWWAPGAYDLTKASIDTVDAAGREVLINSGVEIAWGSQYRCYDVNGNLANPSQFVGQETWGKFLSKIDLSKVDILGIQYYPGYLMPTSTGPFLPISTFVDYMNIYGKFGKPIHITEFSVPSAGYGTWTPETQADYATKIFTLAYGNAKVNSITWWGPMDGDPMLTNHGLLNADGTPKPAFTALKNLIASFSTNAPFKTDAKGKISIPVYAGDLKLTYNGRTTLATVLPGQTTTLTIR